MKHTPISIPIPIFFSLFVSFACIVLPGLAFAEFGLSTDSNAYTIDTDAGLVFKIRRTDNGSNTQSAGDIMSLVYNGVEYQNQVRGSQITSGFDYLYEGVSSVSVSAQEYGADYVKITVEAGELTHYYIARKGYPNIYMATYFTAEPNIHNLCRYIVRIPQELLPNGPEPSDIRNNEGPVESGDIFGIGGGITRSKHYSNMRLIDWDHIGATGDHVGVFMVRSNHEGDSGGPFYRSLLNQCGDDQEITYIINYGQVQTEPFRTSVLNGPYVLAFTDGGEPSVDDDFSWIDEAGMDLLGWVSDAERGLVKGTVSGVPDGFEVVVGFSNAHAQYWTKADPDGSYVSPLMIPGEYAATLYKQELEVAEGTVTVSAGNTSMLDLVSAEESPSFIWKLGDWDGTPADFLNADKVTTMHPSDVRISDWNLGTYVVGESTPQSGIPCYQWKEIAGGDQTIQFELNADQLVDSVVRIGLTVAFAGGRPNIEVNSWRSSFQFASAQPSTRSLTVGSYRGNNTVYTFDVPASALVEGTNTLRIYPISGSGLSGYLSAGYSLDCIEWDGPVDSAPADPAGLTASGDDSEVRLAWQPSPSAVYYKVERAAERDGDYAVLSDKVGRASYVDLSATNETTYFYRVTAVNSIGVSGVSETAGTASSLRAHWRFDETDGADAVDSAGAYDATVASGASWIGGKFGNALQLDGSSAGYATLPSTIIDGLDALTISAWVNASEIPAGARILDFEFGSGGALYLTPASSGSGVLRFAIAATSSESEQSLESVAALPLDGWHHVAVTLSGTSGTLYLDGEVIDSGSIDLTPADLGKLSASYVGKSQDSGVYPTMAIDDFRIFSNALSSVDVSSLAAMTPPSLDVSTTADALQLAWPSNGSGWRLQRRIDLQGDSEWESIPGSETINLYDIPLDSIPKEGLFFRLSYP